MTKVVLRRAEEDTIKNRLGVTYRTQEHWVELSIDKDDGVFCAVFGDCRGQLNSRSYLKRVNADEDFNITKAIFNMSEKKIKIWIEPEKVEFT